MKIRIGNRQIAVLSVLMMLFIFGTSSMEGIAQNAAPEANVPDDNLKAAIREVLDLNAEAPITLAHMSRLTQLKAEDAGISDITGLEEAANLTRLELLVLRRDSEIAPTENVSTYLYTSP